MEREARIALGERLREARMEAKLSVKEMAAEISVSGQAIYSYEEGRNEPPVAALVAYSRRTGRSLDDLVPSSAPSFVNIVTDSADCGLGNLSDGDLIRDLEARVQEVARRLSKR